MQFLFWFFLCLVHGFSASFAELLPFFNVSCASSSLSCRMLHLLLLLTLFPVLLLMVLFSCRVMLLGCSILLLLFCYCLWFLSLQNLCLWLLTHHLHFVIRMVWLLDSMLMSYAQFFCKWNTLACLVLVFVTAIGHLFYENCLVH